MGNKKKYLINTLAIVGLFFDIFATNAETKQNQSETAS